MSGETALILFTMITGVYILSVISRIAERTRRNQVEEEVIRETIKKINQKRRIDELYGRDGEK